MTDQSINMDTSFLRKEFAPAMKAPVSTTGAVAWLKQNMFSDVFSSCLTIGSILFLVWIVPDLVRYLFIDAVWDAKDGVPCRVAGTGACWGFIRENMAVFTYFSYPIDQRWRVDVWMISLFILVLWLLQPNVPKKSLAAFLFFIIFPIATFVLLSGFTGDPAQVWNNSPQWKNITSGLSAIPVLGLLAYIVDPLISLVATVLSGLAWIVTLAYDWLLSSILGLLTGSKQLPKVGTDLWGGIFVSLLVAIIGIVFSLPAGVLLALGRRSDLPLVKFFSVVFIEFVRGVPFITVLFMANTMLPLFVPDYLTPDRLARPLIATALFASAYMAEIVRGGLQAMPKGQYEGAMALGIPYWKMMRLVVLPQALTTVIPGIVNTFIGLFKDTTLVAVVGTFDFLKAIEARRLDANWAGPTISTTGYVFAAIFYFVFCFGMARYSLYMERKLNAGKSH